MLLRDLQRLKRIKQYCEDIQSSICRYGSSLEDFLSDSHYQHAVAFCILQIGELAVSLTQEYRDSTKNRIQWKQIREMRNIVVHDYGNVNLKIVWAVATYDIPELRQFCDEQLASEEQANKP